MVWGLLVLILLIIIAIRVGGSSQEKTTSFEKKCPNCAEWVSPEAKVCKHCSSEFPEISVVPSSIVGVERKKLMAEFNIKFSPLKKMFKYKGNWYNTFEEAYFNVRNEN